MFPQMYKYEFTALFIISKNWQLLPCSIMGAFLSNWWHTHRVEYFKQELDKDGESKHTSTSCPISKSLKWLAQKKKKKNVKKKKSQSFWKKQEDHSWTRYLQNYWTIRRKGTDWRINMTGGKYNSKHIRAMAQIGVKSRSAVAIRSHVEHLLTWENIPPALLRSHFNSKSMYLFTHIHLCALKKW